MDWGTLIKESTSLTPKADLKHSVCNGIKRYEHDHGKSFNNNKNQKIDTASMMPPCFKIFSFKIKF